MSQTSESKNFSRYFRMDVQWCVHCVHCVRSQAITREILWTHSVGSTSIVRPLCVHKGKTRVVVKTKGCIFGGRSGRTKTYSF